MEKQPWDPDIDFLSSTLETSWPAARPDKAPRALRRQVPRSPVGSPQQNGQGGPISSPVGLPPWSLPPPPSLGDSPSLGTYMTRRPLPPIQIPLTGYHDVGTEVTALTCSLQDLGLGAALGPQAQTTSGPAPDPERNPDLQQEPLPPPPHRAPSRRQDAPPPDRPRPLGSVAKCPCQSKPRRYHHHHRRHHHHHHRRHLFLASHMGFSSYETFTRERRLGGQASQQPMLLVILKKLDL